MTIGRKNKKTKTLYKSEWGKSPHQDNTEVLLRKAGTH